jgi:P27 family predicted phage terminase small subunit
MAGRRPKPTQLKILEGNPGRRPLNHNEPKPRAGVPPIPEQLGEVGRQHWAEIVPELDRLNLLTLVDAGSLTAMCLAWEQGLLADALLKGVYDHLTAGIAGRDELWQLSVLTAASKKAWQQYKGFCSEFGLTPASRCRLQTPTGDAKHDPIEEALCG